jgi:hypothetical protein
MNKRAILASINNIANNLDEIGFHQETDLLTIVMKRISKSNDNIQKTAQVASPTGPAATYPTSASIAQQQKADAIKKMNAATAKPNAPSQPYYGAASSAGSLAGPNSQPYYGAASGVAKPVNPNAYLDNYSNVGKPAASSTMSSVGFYPSAAQIQGSQIANQTNTVTGPPNPEFKQNIDRWIAKAQNIYQNWANTPAANRKGGSGGMVADVYNYLKSMEASTNMPANKQYLQQALNSVNANLRLMSSGVSMPGVAMPNMMATGTPGTVPQTQAQQMPQRMTGQQMSQQATMQNRPAGGGTF